MNVCSQFSDIELCKLVAYTTPIHNILQIFSITSKALQFEVNWDLSFLLTLDALANVPR